MSLLLDSPGPSDPFLGLGFRKPSADVYTRALAVAFIPLPAAYFGGEKSALLTVAITVASVFSQMPILFFF